MLTMSDSAEGDEHMSLGQLNGATLVWENADGEEQRVEFSDSAEDDDETNPTDNGGAVDGLSGKCIGITTGHVFGR